MRRTVVTGYVAYVKLSTKAVEKSVDEWRGSAPSAESDSQFCVLVTI
jgi:hypothetical protein